MIDIIQKTIQDHRECVNLFEKHSNVAERIALTIENSLKNNGILYLCGNGGSAADCQHIAGELIGRFRRERKPLPAVALSTDTSVLTCLGNDYHFDHIFSRQVDALVTDKDVLWVFSTSGSSANIIAAAKQAIEKGATVIAFTGEAESPVERLSTLCLSSGTRQTSTTQEIHQLAYHIICDLVERMLE